MSKSNRIILGVLIIVMMMVIVYMTHYFYEISRLINRQQLEGWYELYDSKDNK